MSTSSRKLKDNELPALRAAQEQAAMLPDYFAWLAYMRAHYNYALAVRMATHVGVKLPGREFYAEMAKRGKELIEGVAA